MLGFDGKTLIHPSTIDITNKIYSPSNEEVEYSKKLIEAYEKANTELVTLNGQLIERLHYKNALRIMSIWKRIQELNQILLKIKLLLFYIVVINITIE